MEHFRKLSVGSLFLGIRQADVIHVNPRKLSTSSLLSVCGLALRMLVSHIINVASKPQMVRVNTRLVVSIRAIVENIYSTRNWTTVQNPRRPMRPPVSSGVLYPSGNRSVSTINRSGPNPTGVCLFNIRPEALWKRFGKTLRSQVLGRNLGTHTVSFCASGLLARRAFLF